MIIDIEPYSLPKIEMKIDKDILTKYNSSKTLDKIKNDNDTTKDKEASESA